VARAAPVGPEIHQDGALPRGPDHPLLEIRAIDGEAVGVPGLRAMGVRVVVAVILTVVIVTMMLEHD
jgi:hypothetical protein